MSKYIDVSRLIAWCDKLRDADKKEQLTIMLDDFCSFAERRTDG